MENNLSIFKGEKYQLEYIFDEFGNPWFWGKQICDHVQVKNVSDVLGRLKESEKMSVYHTIESVDGVTRPNQLRVYVNESGLYKILFTGRTKEAEDFQDWVTSEVLPSIRKTGSYSVAPKIETAPVSELVAYALRLQDEHNKRLLVEKQLALEQAISEENQPKVDFANRILSTKETVSVDDLAKIINKNYPMSLGYIRCSGRSLMAFLRVIKAVGRNKNVGIPNKPSQDWMDKGYLELSEYAIERTSGPQLCHQPRITPDGQDKISGLWCFQANDPDIIAKIKGEM